VKKRLRRLVDKHYQLARIYRTMEFVLSDLRGGNGPVIVYQMGKVGSSTVYASLKERKLDRSLYHVHSLTPEGIETGKRMYAQMIRNGADVSASRASHLFAGQYLRRRLERGLGEEEWKVITLMRDPIAINVAAFFQIIDHFVPSFAERYEAGVLEMEEVIEIFLNEFDHEEPLRWFDFELKGALGVDVFASEFPKSKGYGIYRNGQVEVLVLKLEDLNRCAAAAFRDFLGIDNFRVRTKNVAEGKDYHAAYQEFKRGIRLPRSFVDRMYESKCVRHFYSEREISRFKANWLA
jgi:hypothetical protein